MPFDMNTVHEAIDKVKKAAEDLNKSAETNVQEGYATKENQENNSKTT